MDYMLVFINIIISFAIALGFIQFFKNVQFYNKLISFFYMATNLTVMVLLNFANNIQSILDVVVVLFLLEMLMVVIFLSNKLKRNDDI